MDFTALIIIGIVGTVVGFVASRLIEVRAWVETELPTVYRDLTPDQLEALLDKLAYNAAVYVEMLDRDGRLTEIIGDIWDKSKQKLAEAARIALVRAESYLLDRFQLDIDIPEDEIIELIEKNILENPEIFGARQPVVEE